MLLGAIVAGWASWVVAGAVATAADVAEGRRPQGAGFSFLPVVPVFPLLFWGAATLVDRVVSPWGTYSVIALHLGMLLAHIRGTVLALARRRAAGG